MMPYSVEYHCLNSRNSTNVSRLGADSYDKALRLMNSCKLLNGVTRIVLMKNRENGKPEKLAVWTDDIAS